MKYTENGKSYDVGPSGGYVDISSLDLLLKIVGLLVIFLTLFKNVFYSCDQRFFYIYGREYRCYCGFFHDYQLFSFGTFLSRMTVNVCVVRIFVLLTIARVKRVHSTPVRSSSIAR